MKPFEPFEHPADAGILARGRTLEELFDHAGLGLWSLISETDLAAVPADPAVARRIALEAVSVEELLFAWLRELLYFFSAEGMILHRHRFGVLEETRLAAESRGFRFDPLRHSPLMEVKAVTRHQFQVRKTDAGIWEARIIFDV